MKYCRQSKFNIRSMEGYGLFSDLDVELSNISDIYVYLDEEHRDSLKRDLRKFYYEETNADSWQFSDTLLYYKDMVAKMIQEQYDNQKSNDGGKRANMRHYRQGRVGVGAVSSGYGLYSETDNVLNYISGIYDFLDEEHREALKKELRRFYEEETNTAYWQFSDALIHYQDKVRKMIREQFDRQDSEISIDREANMRHYRQGNSFSRISGSYNKRAGREEESAIDNTLDFFISIHHLVERKQDELIKLKNDINSLIEKHYIDTKDKDDTVELLELCNECLSSLEKDITNFDEAVRFGKSREINSKIIELRYYS